MTEFAESWTLCRQRFINEVAPLSDLQLRWKPNSDALSIGEMSLHVVGVEVSFATQLLGLELTDQTEKLKLAATCGVVNELPFPFGPEEITAELVASSFDLAKDLVEPLITDPSEAVLNKEIKSALGPVITGRGALARFAFHPAYHHGQAYLIKTLAGFPA